MDENPYKSAQATALIIMGLLVAWGTPYLIAISPGGFPTLLFWCAGWFLVAIGGWLIPNRLAAGIVIGIAIASVGYFIFLVVSLSSGMG